jgi:hypothetical protein
VRVLNRRGDQRGRDRTGWRDRELGGEWVSHRALVAVEREGGHYDLIEIRGAVLAHEHVDRFRRTATDDLPPIDRTELATDVPADALAGYVDPVRHETLTVVGREGEPSAYLVLWYDAAIGSDGERGALVTYDPGDRTDEAYLRGWWHGLTDGVGSLVDESIDEREAFACLRDRVEALREGREVRLL